MGEAIVFTSGKGGVGKTTCVANIGAALSLQDKKVLLLDTDMGLRNLDVVMGLEHRVTYNLLDVLANQCRLNQAMIRDKRFANLYVIPASLRNRMVFDYRPQFKLLLDCAKQDFDYILIDCPAGIDYGFDFAVSQADRAIVVTTPQVSAVKDAGRVMTLLEQMGIYRVELLVNMTNERLKRRHEMLSEQDICAILGAESIGSIPMDERVLVAQNQGELCALGKGKTARAYRRAAAFLPYQRLKPIDLALEAPILHGARLYLGKGAQA